MSIASNSLFGNYFERQTTMRKKCVLRPILHIFINDIYYADTATSAQSNKSCTEI